MLNDYKCCEKAEYDEKEITWFREGISDEVISEQRPKEVKKQGSFLKESFLGEGIIASTKTKRRNVSYL